MKNIIATVVFDFHTVYINPFETLYDLEDDLEAYIESDIIEKLYEFVPGITEEQKKIIFDSIIDIQWEDEE